MKKYTLLFAIIFSSTLFFAQSITSINPITGIPLEPLTVTITGQNTNFSQATNTAVWFSQGSETIEYANIINAVSDTELDANITFNANYNTPIVYDVNVYNEIDGIITFPLSFTLQTLPTPYIVSVTPDQGNKFDVLNVTIGCANTHFNQATNTAVWFSQGSETIIPVQNSTTGSTSVDGEFIFPYSCQTGYYDVNVFSELDGYLSYSNGFYLNDIVDYPYIGSVSPENILTNETVTIQITGVNTHFQFPGNFDIWCDSDTKEIILAESVTVVNNERIDATFTFPENTPFQTYNLHINSDFDGEIVLESGFHVGPNLIQSFDNTELFVAPNPSKDIFHINSKESIDNIKLFDINGKFVESFNVFSKQTSLNLNYLAKGVYFLKIRLKDQTVTKSIIIE